MPREKGKEEFDPAYLHEILHSAAAIGTYVEGRTFDDFLDERMFRVAVEREIQIIGEAANCLSKAYRAAHPEIPWSAIIAQRHIVTHEYYQLDLELIWQVAVRHVPELRSRLLAISETGIEPTAEADSAGAESVAGPE